MTQLPPITINRYENEGMQKAGWLGTIRPTDDDAWLIFVDTDNVPHLYVRTEEPVDCDESPDQEYTYRCMSYAHREPDAETEKVQAAEPDG